MMLDTDPCADLSICISYSCKILIINFGMLGLRIKPLKDHMSLIMRKPVFCICENKGTNQLNGNYEVDQHLCFRYVYNTTLLLLKSEISIL